jgi:hypothetical protein
VIGTASFSDGMHTVGHCVTDFAGNVACVAPRTIAIDNTPPAHPRSLAVVGGEAWRRANDFDLSWTNPDQGPGSPIWGAFWRVLGPAGFDTGVQFAPGRDIAALRKLHMPLPGAYLAQLWLRDEAGNEAPASAVSVPLRLDDVAPGVAFAAESGPGLPEAIRAEVSDVHSGPAAGEIVYRRLGTERWLELPTKFEPGELPESARLITHLPNDLAPGTYVFRADALDRAGNKGSSSRRADGTEMAIRKVPPPPAPKKPPEPAAAKTRLFAGLHWRKRRGSSVTIPFGATATLSGRLLSAEGAGLAGRHLKVVSRPSRGALARRRAEMVVTGEHGGFRLALKRGPSRRITVTYRGEPGLERAQRPALALRVQGGAILHAAPLQLQTGDAVRLWGRVRTRGAPLPRRGKLVAIQYFESATRRWRPVLVTRTNHGGRFRARYRFRYISGSARIRLRAVALAEERWPYVPGASRPVTVEVSG